MDPAEQKARGAQFALHPDDIVQAAEHRLHCSAWSALHSVTCHSRAGVLTLTGRVPTYHLKQVASAVVGDMAGVR